MPAPVTAPHPEPSETVREPGRALDALVAEKVMGYHVERVTPEWYGGTEVMLFSRPGSDLIAYSCDSRSCNAMMFRNGVDDKQGIADVLPSYSDDLTAAWEVVEEMQTLHPGWRFSLLGGDTSFAMVRVAHAVEVDYGQREAFGWHAEFFGHEDPAKNTGQRHASEYAETPALAICLAALAAVESSRA